MNEVWIKKTIYRRYLVDDSEIENVKTILECDSTRADELIADCYDTNENIEYDEEEVILPLEYSICALGN